MKQNLQIDTAARWFLAQDGMQVDVHVRREDRELNVCTNVRPEYAPLIIAAPDLLEACKLLYRAWEQLLPNLKNGVVQDYALVCTEAPTKARTAIAKAEAND